MSDMGDLIAAGLLGQPNASGLTANQAHEIGERVASRVAPLDAAWKEAEAALPEGWELDLSRWADGACGVVASLRVDGLTSRVFKVVDPFPAAALRALTAQLRERAG